MWKSWRGPTFAHAGLRALVVAVAVALGAGPPNVARAEENESSSTPQDYNAPDPERDWQHYVIPVGTVTLSNAIVWGLSRALDTDGSHISLHSIGRNFTSGWQFDGDSFSTNFLWHPYQGSIYFGSARAFGLNFWESLPYVLLGSLEWEYFAETGRPSGNDVITTTLSGIALGEMLFRLSNEVLDDTAHGFERVVRETVAGVLSPANEFYRLTSGRAWRQGRPPLRRLPLELAFHLGPQFYNENTAGPDVLATNVGVEVDLRYGKLSEAGSTVGPFELFTLLAIVRLFNGNNGASVFSEGTLWGWKWALGCPTCTSTLLSFTQSYEYQNLPLFDYGAMALGVANHWAVPLGGGKQLVAGVRVEGVPIGAVSSPPGVVERNYTFGGGWHTGADLYLDLQRWGTISLLNGQTFLTVMSGADGTDFFGWLRLGYTLPVFRGFGVGASASFFFRDASYAGLPSWDNTCEIFQVYAAYLP